MKILVLGDSGSSGELTEGTSWTTVLRDHLAERLDEEIELVQDRWVPTGNRATEIAVTSVARRRPDLVVMPVGNYVFTAPFVWLRVRKFFGRRIGQWFRSIEQSINATTYEKGRLRNRLNKALRTVAHRAIGAETITTSEESARVYEETFQQLAQSESMQIMVVPGARLRKIFHDPSEADQLTRYLDAVRQSAEARHFLFVETAPAFKGQEQDARFMQSDGLHGTPAYHDVLGEYVAGAYLRHVGTAANLVPKRTTATSSGI